MGCTWKDLPNDAVRDVVISSIIRVHEDSSDYMQKLFQLMGVLRIPFYALKQRELSVLNECIISKFKTGNNDFTHHLSALKG